MLCVLILPSVNGCEIFTKEKDRETQEGLTSLSIEDVCDFFRPIYFSREDTVETQDQVIDYLITLNAICGGLHGTTGES